MQIEDCEKGDLALKEMGARNREMLGYMGHKSSSRDELWGRKGAASRG